ncbi:MAG TPA: PEP-CTERM sorting domain-containing protein [Acetobacteraceae bacterium]|jgi:hypothetical protein|nr:PEP-CTERM sorting domain-containing protein [Acetobacteraceae bacterium]
MRYSSYLLAGTLLAGFAFAGSPAQATPSGVCPVVGSSTDCGAIITFGPGGAISTVLTGSAPFDGIEDTSIGVVNNSGHSISTIHLVQTTTGTPIFGFDGDGIDTFGVPGNASDTTGYGGSNAFFTNFSSGTSGDVNFITAIASGSSSYFSLEGPASLNFNPTPTPEPATLAILGLGLAGLAAVRRRKR